MEAFEQNIDALEQKFELLFQKWNDTLDLNLELKERNKVLEDKLKSMSPDQNETQITETDKLIKLKNIEQALDDYIEKIDNCLEIINIELDEQ